MPHAQFKEFAAYNRWVNRRIYETAAGLTDEVRTRDVGLYFGSVHGTLNHLLVADYIWMRRFTGNGPLPERLNLILHEDFAALRDAREAEDERIITFIDQIDDFERILEYQNSTGRTFRQRLGSALAHFFNHQTHHRGQVHAGLTIAGITEPESQDLLAYQRTAG